VGPVGRGAHSSVTTGDWTLHPAYAYAHSQGLFVGMSVEGSILKIRPDVNAKFYDDAKQTTAFQLLQRPGCPAAQPLYDAADDEVNFTNPTQLPELGVRVDGRNSEPRTAHTPNEHGPNSEDHKIY
jgi:lipid-binding SYLF domain-containing protein